MVPPSFLTTLISLKSTLTSLSFSTILITASTASGANYVELDETTLDAKDVCTHYINYSLLFKSTTTFISSNISNALFSAI